MSSSSQSSPINRSRRQSNNQPHHVMTQPVYLQKIFPFVASKPSTPLFFKSITSSWSETVVHYHGALWCWGALFKEYSGDDDGEHDDDNSSSDEYMKIMIHEDNDDSSGGNTVRDRSAAEIFRLLETSFRELEHADSLWIIDAIFELLEHLKVRIRKEDIDDPHFEVFGALFESEVSAQTGNTLTFFNKLFGFFDCRAMLPDVLTEFRPFDLPQQMDGIITRIIDKIEELELEEHSQHSERFEKLAAFLHACFNWCPRNCVVANHLFRPHTPKHQLGDRDRSGRLALVVFDVDNPVTDSVLTFALEHSTPEIVRLVVSFLASYGLDRDVFPRAVDREEDRSHLRRSILMRITTDFQTEKLASVIDHIIAIFGGDFFVGLYNSESTVPYFSVASALTFDRRVGTVALLIKKISEIGGDEAIQRFIEVQSVVEPASKDHHLTGKSSIHFAIEHGRPEVLKYLLNVAEGFGQEYFEFFISIPGHCTEHCVDLPPLYFALRQSNTRVTSMIIDKLRSLGDDFLRDQIDSMFDESDLGLGRYDGYDDDDEDDDEDEYALETSSRLITSLLKFVDASEVTLLLERNLKKYELDDHRNFIRQLKTVASAEWLVKLITKVDADDFFCQYMTSLCEKDAASVIPSDVLQYLEQALKLMELDQEELDDGKMKMK